MSYTRRVITKQLQSANNNLEPDSYLDKVIKNIPADIIGVWLFLSGAIKSADDIPVQSSNLLWVVFLILLLLTPVWILRQTKLEGEAPAYKQAFLGMVSFFIWVLAIGGPFVALDQYHPIYGTILLGLHSLFVPMFFG